MTENRARRYFADEELPKVLDIPSRYGREKWRREEERVKGDALIISKGSIDVLSDTIRPATWDYRDVLISEAIDEWVIEEIRRCGA